MIAHNYWANIPIHHCLKTSILFRVKRIFLKSRHCFTKAVIQANFHSWTVLLLLEPLKFRRKNILSMLASRKKTCGIVAGCIILWAHLLLISWVFNSRELYLMGDANMAAPSIYFLSFGLILCFKWKWNIFLAVYIP